MAASKIIIMVITMTSARISINAIRVRKGLLSFFSTDEELANIPQRNTIPMDIASIIIHTSNGVQKFSVHFPSSHLIPSLLSIDRVTDAGNRLLTIHEPIISKTSITINDTAT